MHELSVCQALVEQIEQLAEAHGASGVAWVTLGIGPLSGVEAALLEMAYPIACAGSVAEGSELRITTCPVRVRCLSCGAQTDASPNRLVCGACGDWHTRLIGGDELLLERLELINTPLTETG